MLARPRLPRKPRWPLLARGCLQKLPADALGPVRLSASAAASGGRAGAAHDGTAAAAARMSRRTTSLGVRSSRFVSMSSAFASSEVIRMFSCRLGSSFLATREE